METTLGVPAAAPAWREVILAIIAQRPGLQLDELARELHISPLIAHQRVSQLMMERRVERTPTRGIRLAARRTDESTALTAGAPERHQPKTQVLCVHRPGQYWLMQMLLAIGETCPGTFEHIYIGRGQVEVRLQGWCCLTLGWSPLALLGELRAPGRSCQFTISNADMWRKTSRVILRELSQLEATAHGTRLRQAG